MSDAQTIRPIIKRHDPNRLERELAEITRSIERQANEPAKAEPVKQGVAEDLAKFIEQHADEMLKEAQQHRDDAYAYAKEIRDQTAEQMARLSAFTNSIKASQAEMAEVRARFLSSGTKDDGGGRVVEASTQDEKQS